MAWLTQFKLGIPGSEYTFDVNPGTMSMVDGPVQVKNVNLAGDSRTDIPKNFKPTATINSNHLTLAQKSQFIGLACLPAFLSFQTRDDMTFFEQDTPDSTSLVTIRGNSITLLDKALNDISGAANLTITGVFTTIAGSGTNYYTGGSYARATRVITLGTPLPNLNDCFVFYSYIGWMANIEAVNSVAQGGWVDLHTYDFVIEGV